MLPTTLLGLSLLAGRPQAPRRTPCAPCASAAAPAATGATWEELEAALRLGLAALGVEVLVRLAQQRLEARAVDAREEALERVGRRQCI